ncbi:reverse transcriptase domain-containing protein [Tanacetum coccineum]
MLKPQRPYSLEPPLQEFDIEIKDKKCIEIVAADQLSRIEKEETSNDTEVDDNFPRETLMEINTKDDPWFADFANYLVFFILFVSLFVSCLMGFDSMGDSRSFKSKEDLTQRISKSVFVTNFPDHFSARDLWNVCTAYGKVIDVYIPLMSHPAKAETRSVTSWISSKHNGVNNRETLNAQLIIMEYFVKISKNARILKFKLRNLKNAVLKFNTPYPSRKIRRIYACTSQETTKNRDLYVVSRRLLYAVSKI